jgi:hypothetical protein
LFLIKDFISKERFISMGWATVNLSATFIAPEDPFCPKLCKLMPRMHSRIR